MHRQKSVQTSEQYALKAHMTGLAAVAVAECCWTLFLSGSGTAQTAIFQFSLVPLE
jgi:hypothetical protein